MGTLSDWLWVLVIGAFCAVSMARTSKSRNRSTNNRTGRILYALKWILYGLLAGILIIF